MFIQVIQGPVANADAMREQFETWHRDLAPGATGWLGSTAGMSSDGEFAVVVRFADEAAARANGERPDQGTWWARTAELFDAEPVFHDYPHATLLFDGGSDDAGFVQLIQGVDTSGSPDDALDDGDDLREERPDVIGGSLGWDDDGHFTQTVYFTSEAEARAGEAREGGGEDMAEWVERVRDMRFVDLTDPWLVSP